MVGGERKAAILNNPRGVELDGHASVEHESHAGHPEMADTCEVESCVQDTFWGCGWVHIDHLGPERRPQLAVGRRR